MKTRNAGVCLVVMVAMAGPARPGVAEDSPSYAVAFRGVEPPRSRAASSEPAIRNYTVTYAAEELAGYMSKVLGAKVDTAPWPRAAGDVVFLVTEEKHAPEGVREALKDKRLDAFVIKYPCVVEGRTVCLMASRDSQGYLFPVYHFLTEYMGVDWVGPDEGGTVLAARPDWTMPERIDVLEDPDYEHRAWSSLAVDARKWLANGQRLAFHHGLHKAFDPSLYSDQPDLYPFYEGARHVPDASIRALRVSRWQPCTSNPKVVDMAVEYGLGHLNMRPEIRSFSLSVNDGGIGYCMCDGCLALDSKDAWDHGSPWLSDRFYRFYNAVMERVVEKRPDAYMAVLGYNRIKTPPTEVKIHPRIIVFNCIDNTSPIPDMIERQKAWIAAGAIPALYFRVPDLGFLTVRHYPHALADVIRFTSRQGGFGFYTETITNFAAGGPKMYVLAHVLWDVDADVDQLLDRYMLRAFGAGAAPHVRAYFDRWEEIWERGDPVLRYDTTRGNKYAGQLDELTRADLEAMDAALAAAGVAPATAEEKKRWEYVSTYYRWLRPNADQYLLARELADDGWVDRLGAEEVFCEAERGLALTDEFNRLWDTVIAKDQTGWYLSLRIEGNVDVAWQQYVLPVREGVLATYETGLDAAFDRITERMLGRQSKASVADFWKAQIDKHPQLAKWAGTQLCLLEGSGRENLLANGDFEEGQAGPPPVIPGWELRGQWQGVPSEFAWQAGAGVDNSSAAGVGKCRIAEFHTALPTEAGRRYRLSLSYRSTIALNAAASIFIHGLPAGRLPLAPTGGAWTGWSTTFTAPQDRTAIVLEVKGVDKGEWVWFDDVELVEISRG